MPQENLNNPTRRCRHGMMDGTCAFCLGIVTKSPEDVGSGVPSWFVGYDRIESIPSVFWPHEGNNE